jgi:hypothetical protein
VHHAGGPAGGDGARRPVAGRLADRYLDRGAAFRGAHDLAGRRGDPPQARWGGRRWRPDERAMTDDTSSALWIKDPLGILADGAERGVVVQDGRIVELVAAGREPRARAAKTFDAGAL